MYIPPALAAVHFHLPPDVMLYGYVALLCLISLCVAYRALSSEAHEIKQFWMAAAVTTLFVVPSLCFVFGDREHLVFVFTLPWIIEMLLWRRPRTLSILWALPGFFLKPYNLIFFAALQLLGGPKEQKLHERIFAPASFILGAAGVAYVACLYIFFPNYPTKLVPLMLTAYPYVYATLFDKLRDGGPITLVGMALVFECIADAKARRLWYGFLAAGFIAYLCNAGWGYTLNLIFTPLWLLCFALWRQSDAGIMHRLPAGIAGWLTRLMMVLILLLTCDSLAKDIYYTHKDGYAKNYTHLPPAFYKQLHTSAGQEFILLSTSLWATNLDVLGGTPHHVFAYDSLWPLPWLYSHPDDKRRGAVYSLVVPKLAEAITTYPQATLIVDTSPAQYKMPNDTDLLAYFRKDAEVNAALAPYRLVQTLEDCGDPLRDEDIINAECRYAIWRRAD